MSQEVNFRAVTFSDVYVNDNTTWTFAEFTDDSGLTATVEITSGDHTVETIKLLSEAVVFFKGKTIMKDSSTQTLLGYTDYDLQKNRAAATAISALRTATTDLLSQKTGKSLATFLGGRNPGDVLLYANINRHLYGGARTPEAFAEAAALAVSRGFKTVKCAPFDEVHSGLSEDENLSSAEIGLDRISSVRHAIGPDIDLLIDCHGRFHLNSAKIVASKLVKSNVAWFEEPVEPTEHPDQLISIRDSIDLLVAGGESVYGSTSFKSLVIHRALDIIMPDVKYCGGVSQAYDAGLDALSLGANVSLHSPSGPVSLMHSAHVTAAIDNDLTLEHAVYEADWRSELIDPFETISDGKIALGNSSGTGIKLNKPILQKYGRQWSP